MENREFVATDDFNDAWAKLGLDDNDLAMLQIELLNNPQAGDMVKGSGGLRKVRFALSGKGKSGGARVVYVDFAAYETICLIDVYSKKDKSDVSAAELKIIKKLIAEIKNSVKGDRK